MIELQTGRPQAGRALFALGFRPFFMVAGAGGLVLLAIWVYFFATGGGLSTYYGGTIWHSHEMLYGYAVAVIAGFLLTAVGNWTGLPTITGTPLALLTVLWLAGRILPFFPHQLPGWLIAGIDLAFLPALAVALAVPLLRRKQKHNLFVVPLLGLLALANLLIHLQVLGVTQSTARVGTYLAINLIIVLIAVVAGRVLPFFTERALAGVSTKSRPGIERLAIGVLVVLAVTQVFFPQPIAIALLSLAAAAIHGIRLAGWYTRRIWSVPILWVLHAGYAWLVVGFGLQSLAYFGWISPLLALHALTVGGIGTLTLGMMARVALGHTGRTMQASRAMVSAFVLIGLAAVSRALLPIAFPHWYIDAIMLSGVLWVCAFFLFVLVCTPMLVSPRVDGRPG